MRGTAASSHRRRPPSTSNATAAEARTACRRWSDGSSAAQAQSEPAQSGLEQALSARHRRAGGRARARPAVSAPVAQRRDDPSRHRVAARPTGGGTGSSWWHGGDLGQRRDQARDRACGELGWMVVRYDESFLEDPAHQRPRTAFDLTALASDPSEILSRSSAERTETEEFRVEMAREQAGRAESGREGGSVARCCIDLARCGIEWIPGWRWHES